jgi:hypothetical protein
MTRRKSPGSSKVSKHEKELQVRLLRKHGELGLYEKSVGAGMMEAATNKNYDVEILNLSKSFWQLYCRTGNEDYASVSRVLRRAAHAIYRQLVKQGEKNSDPRFLTLVKC